MKKYINHYRKQRFFTYIIIVFIQTQINGLDTIFERGLETGAPREKLDIE